MLLDSRSRLPSPSPKLYDRPTLASSDTSESSLGSRDSDPASLATSSVPTASLLVTNLPTLLFSQAQDLHPLFFPFGHIEKLEIVQVSPLGTMSVVVQYSATHVAQEAKETLSGQLYGSYQIEARYVKPIRSNLLDISTSGLLALDRKTDGTGNFLGQPRATLDDHTGCYDTGRMKGLAHSSQLSFATGPFFHRDSLAIPPPRQSPFPALPSALPSKFQDYDSRLSSVDSRLVYYHFFSYQVSHCPQMEHPRKIWTSILSTSICSAESNALQRCLSKLCCLIVSLESWADPLFEMLRQPPTSLLERFILSLPIFSIECYFLNFIPRLLVGCRFVLADCYIGLERVERKVGCLSDFVT